MTEQELQAAFENRYRASKQAEAEANAMMWFIETRTAMLIQLTEELNETIRWRETHGLEPQELRKDYAALSQYRIWLENIEVIWKNRANGSQWSKDYYDIQELWYAIKVTK